MNGFPENLAQSKHEDNMKNAPQSPTDAVA
jgi:hypothetical protein